ncbi:MAG TPA: peptide deformylase [Blastocatellia bacterium]|nr:peptide deformylase [Blastocatellia bacterium]HMX27393.1 peptide deformylase [Blastocatellia bacterium]HMY75559.1 peptide deformylase [Blastocatellia bacterium]HMZ20833.1 peptide deformylase [Blastocatellia bacterium]HNG29035.1 peptide deformylase [Blastocatellia bacterium]
MILPIVKYGDPVLQKEGEEITNIDGQMADFISNMFETMYEAKGVGLAAPQVAMSKKLFVMDVSVGKELKERIICINPQIVDSKGKVVSEEGCLSFPGIYFEVERPEIVTVQALDLNGNEFVFEADGLAARCVLHEKDHIDGKVFIEYLNPLKRDLVKRKIKKKIKLGEWE